MARLNNAEVDLIFARLLQAMRNESSRDRNVVKISDARGNSRLKDKTEFLRRHQEADEKCAKDGSSFSLSCGGCEYEDRPSVFSTACGHVFCRECTDGKEACLVCIKPCSFRPLFDGENRSRECQICFNETPCTRGIYTGCGHVFCYTCIVQIPSKSQSTCPFCRVKSVKIVILKEKKIEKTDNVPSIPTVSTPVPPKSKFILTRIASRVRSSFKTLFKRH